MDNKIDLGSGSNISNKVGDRTGLDQHSYRHIFGVDIQEKSFLKIKEQKKEDREFSSKDKADIKILQSSTLKYGSAGVAVNALITEQSEAEKPRWSAVEINIKQSNRAMSRGQLPVEQLSQKSSEVKRKEDKRTDLVSAVIEDNSGEAEESSSGNSSGSSVTDNYIYFQKLIQENKKNMKEIIHDILSNLESNIWDRVAGAFKKKGNSVTSSGES